MTTSPVITLNNGVSMPQVGYGVFQTPPEATAAAVREALEVGYRHVDTAQAYANEEGVAQGLADSGVPREDVFITTKVWISNAGQGPAARSIDGSLRRLGSDYIDLLLVHQPFGDYYGTYRAMEKALAQGRNNLFTHPVLVEIGRRHGLSAAQVALRFLLDEGVIVIPKTVHRERMVDNLEVVDVALDPADLEVLRALDAGASLFADHEDPELAQRLAGMRAPGA